LSVLVHGWAGSPPVYPTGKEAGDAMTLAQILWIILAVVLIIWLWGLLVGGVGPAINVLLVVALLILLYNLFVGPRPVA
jgi:Flp pilus assembly protein TadB